MPSGRSLHVLWELEPFFRRHAAHISEIFWDVSMYINQHFGHLITSLPSQQFLSENVGRYSTAIYTKCCALQRCLDLLDGTVIEIARPDIAIVQRVCYNGHKRHSLKYQGVVGPDGSILHCFGPVEGKRHDWMLYNPSNLEELLLGELVIGGRSIEFTGIVLITKGHSWLSHSLWRL